MTWIAPTRHYLRTHAFLIVAAIALGIAIAGFIRPFQAPPAQSDDPATAAAALQKAFINVVDNVKPAVVKISAEQKVIRRGNLDDFFDLMPPWAVPEPREERRPVLGSGVIIDKEGYILTADHVVEDVETEAEATSVEVTLTNGEEYEGKVLGTDRASYGMNGLIEPKRFAAQQLMLMDANWTHLDVTQVAWMDHIKPRHMGKVNVVTVGGSVRSMTMTELRDQYMLYQEGGPDSGSPWGCQGGSRPMGR